MGESNLAGFGGEMRFGRVRFCIMLLIALVFSGCGEVVTKGTSPRILAMGDSLLAWNALSEQSVSHRVEDILGEPVIDRSVNGARLLYELPISGALGMSIPAQYRSGEWDWIIVNGGGNDLWLGCGCSWCNRKLDRLISPDGRSGEITNLIARLRATGAQVIYVGYLRSPGLGSPIEHCRDEGDELEKRIADFAKGSEGVHFLSLAELVPRGDRSFHAFDMIHPSYKASAAIAERIATIIATQ